MCSTLVTKTPLRSPSAPSRVDMELGHQEHGQALGAGPGALRAGQHQVDDVLRHVVLAAGDEPLHALDVPGAVRLLRWPWSGRRRRRNPASGSVSTMVEAQPRSTASSANRFCSGVPSQPQRLRHERADSAYIQTAGLAPSTSSASAQPRDRGAPVPPRLGRELEPVPLGVDERAVGPLERSGMRTEWVAGSKTGGLRSASANDSASGPGGEPVHLVEDAARGVLVHVGERAARPADPGAAAPRTG